MLIKDVAESFSIHPNRIATWRKKLRMADLGVQQTPALPRNGVPLPPRRDAYEQLIRLQLKHELDQAIRFVAERKMKASHSATASRKPKRNT